MWNVPGRSPMQLIYLASVPAKWDLHRNVTVSLYALANPSREAQDPQLTHHEPTLENSAAQNEAREPQSSLVFSYQIRMTRSYEWNVRRPVLREKFLNK